MILAVANQKGGVGKTTTAINLAAGIAKRGSRVLLIDLDPQANSTISFVSADDYDKSVYDVMLEDNVSFADVTLTTNTMGLDLAPGRLTLAKFEYKMVGELDAHFRLKDRLAKARRKYDHIVIDTAPTLGLLTMNALVAASHVIIPIQASYFAMEGTDDLLDTIKRIRQRANKDLKILGVLVTLYDKRTVLSRDIRGQIENVFGERVFGTMITKNVRLEEAPAYKEDIFAFAPSCSGAKEYAQLTEEVLQRV